MEQSPMIKFLEMTKSDDELIDTYTTIRTWLQREGYTTDSATRINGAPAEIWSAKENLSSGIEKLKKSLKMYGVLDSIEEFNNYLIEKLKEVDKKFPLIDEI